MTIMVCNSRSRQPAPNQRTSTTKNNLADFLTVSRAVIGLVILSLSSIGKDVYTTVVILTLVGAATDVLDGRAARRYLGNNREGKLGKHDLTVDTFFVLCVLAYFSLSGIVMPKVLGLVWIVLALVSAFVWKLKAKVLTLFEIPTILALFAIAGIYDLKLFFLVIVSTMLAGVIFNWDRMWYVLRVKIPRDFSE